MSARYKRKQIVGSDLHRRRSNSATYTPTISGDGLWYSNRATTEDPDGTANTPHSAAPVRTRQVPARVTELATRSSRAPTRPPGTEPTEPTTP